MRGREFLRQFFAVETCGRPPGRPNVAVGSFPAPAKPPPTQRLDDLPAAFSNTLTAPLQHLRTAEAGT